MDKVLILGGRAPVALDHARRFAHQSWQAYVADSVPCRLSGWSNSVSATVLLTPPRTNPQAYVADLTRAITQHGIDLVVPTCEEVFFLSRYRDALPKSLNIVVDDFDKLRMLHSKWNFQTLAKECGGNPPKSTLVRTISQAREWAGTSPLVLKPEFSRFGVHVRIRPSGLPPDEPELGHLGQWVAQEFRAGTELCSYSVAHGGRLLAHCVYQPLHRIGKSSSYYFAHSETPCIQQFVEKFVAKIGFTGQISFDWIESAEGIPSVIECNPRAISGVHLFAQGDPLPSALAGTATTCVHPSQTNPRMLTSIMLTAGLVEAVKGAKLAAWLHDIKAATDVLGVPGDRLPALGALRDIGSFARLARQYRCTMREAATQDIEWDGQDLVALC